MNPLRWSAAAIAAAALTGCTAESPPSAAPSTSAAPSSSAAAAYEPPAAFDGLDPCSLATPAEAASLTGAPDLRPARNEGMRPDSSLAGRIDICGWMSGAVDPLAVTLNIADPSRAVEQGRNLESVFLAAELGHPVNADYGTDPAALGIEDCVTYVGYSADRTVGVILRRPATATTPAPTDTDNLCARHRTTLRDILARVPWA